MSKPNIDWSAMTNEEYKQLGDEFREDGARRMRLIEEALGIPKGPGRPRNGSKQLTAADLESAD